MIQPINGLGENDGKPLVEDASNVFLLPKPGSTITLAKNNEMKRVDNYSLPAASVVFAVETSGDEPPKKKKKSAAKAKNKSKGNKGKSKGNKTKSTKSAKPKNKKRPLDKGSSCTTDTDAATPNEFTLQSVLQSFANPKGS